MLALNAHGTYEYFSESEEIKEQEHIWDMQGTSCCWKKNWTISTELWQLRKPGLAYKSSVEACFKHFATTAVWILRVSSFSIYLDPVSYQYHLFHFRQQNFCIWQRFLSILRSPSNVSPINSGCGTWSQILGGRGRWAEPRHKRRERQGWISGLPRGSPFWWMVKRSTAF